MSVLLGMARLYLKWASKWHLCAELNLDRPIRPSPVVTIDCRAQYLLVFSLKSQCPGEATDHHPDPGQDGDVSDGIRKIALRIAWINQFWSEEAKGCEQKPC